MNRWLAETGSLSNARQWVYGLWEFYRQYTHSAIHAASAAALTIFGLLVFIDPLFAGVAIAAYVCPPVVLYTLGVDVGGDSDREASTGGSIRNETGPVAESPTSSESGDGDTDSDSGDGDTDSDSGDGDTDSDSGDGDTDSDSDS